MKRKLRPSLFIFFILPFTLSACASSGKRGEQASWHDDWRACAVVGAVVGGGIGAADDSDHVGQGAAIGALLGGALCALIPEGEEGEADTDGDGVYDNQDQCPDTPTGAQVDATGCPLDSDGDGVPDFKDKCPNTPTGANVNAQGCELDRDGDGVVDSQDRCPNTPTGATVNAQGCELDSDGDGVADSQDRCPDSPANTQVDAQGCERIVLRGVLFDDNSADLSGPACAVLDTLIRPLHKHSNAHIEITGHTDNRGSEQYNFALSKQRANAVRNYLISQGVEPGQLSSSGLGETQPIADNDSTQGRAENRRVELKRTL